MSNSLYFEDVFDGFQHQDEFAGLCSNMPSISTPHTIPLEYVHEYSTPPPPFGMNSTKPTNNVGNFYPTSLNSQSDSSIAIASETPLSSTYTMNDAHLQNENLDPARPQRNPGPPKRSGSMRNTHTVPKQGIKLLQAHTSPSPAPATGTTGTTSSDCFTERSGSVLTSAPLLDPTPAPSRGSRNSVQSYPTYPDLLATTEEFTDLQAQGTLLNDLPEYESTTPLPPFPREKLGDKIHQATWEWHLKAKIRTYLQQRKEREENESKTGKTRRSDYNRVLFLKILGVPREHHHKAQSPEVLDLITYMRNCEHELEAVRTHSSFKPRPFPSNAPKYKNPSILSTSMIKKMKETRRMSDRSSEEPAACKSEMKSPLKEKRTAPESDPGVSKKCKRGKPIIKLAEVNPSKTDVKMTTPMFAALEASASMETHSDSSPLSVPTDPLDLSKNVLPFHPTSNLASIPSEACQDLSVKTPVSPPPLTQSVPSSHVGNTYALHATASSVVQTSSSSDSLERPSIEALHEHFFSVCPESNANTMLPMRNTSTPTLPDSLSMNKDPYPNLYIQPNQTNLEFATISTQLDMAPSPFAFDSSQLQLMTNISPPTYFTPPPTEHKPTTHGPPSLPLAPPQRSIESNPSHLLGELMPSPWGRSVPGLVNLQTLPCFSTLFLSKGSLIWSLSTILFSNGTTKILFLSPNYIVNWMGQDRLLEKRIPRPHGQVHVYVPIGVCLDHQGLGDIFFDFQLHDTIRLPEHWMLLDPITTLQHDNQAYLKQPIMFTDRFK